MSHREMTRGGKLADAISRMVLRVDLSEGHEGGQSQQAVLKNHHHGPLKPQELGELSFLCTAAAASNGIHDADNDESFSSVDGDLLVALTALLTRHVNLAVSSANIVDDAVKLRLASDDSSPSQVAASEEKWFREGQGRDKLDALRGGLEAAAIIAFIASQATLECRAVDEDSIEKCITLMRLHLSKHLVPALNNSMHYIASRKDDGGPSPHKKRRRSSNAAAATSGVSVAAKDLKKVYKYICGTTNAQLVLMDRLESLVQSIPMDDRHILLLSNGVLPALQVDCSGTSKTSGKHLQLSVIAILTSVFRRYPQHRETIVEDFFPIMINLPTGKRSLRAYPVRYSSSAAPDLLKDLNSKEICSLLSSTSPMTPEHSLQMMSALVLALVQACVQRPTYEVIPSVDETHVIGSMQSGLRTCHVIADSFVGQLLKRCQVKNSEYRTILGNFVDDFVSVLLIPEYPAAELLVASLQRRINHDLTLASPVFETTTHHTFEVTYLNTIFDVMGKICAVQARVLSVAGKKAMLLSRDKVTTLNYSDDLFIDCHCGSLHDDVFMIQCDFCKKVVHGSCVGVPNKESVPDEWKCDSCCLSHILKLERPNLPENEESFLNERYALRHSLQAATAHRLGIEITDAVHFHLSKWIDELESQGKSKGTGQPRKLTGSLLDYWDTPGPASAPLSEEGSVRVILNLMAKVSPFFLSFRKQTGFLLKIMADQSSHALRKQSLKVIEKIVEGDQSLMLFPILTKAVSRRLSDESISVREAAVSLVGSYVVNSKSHLAIQKYYSALIPCLTDPGVSVRKRAVKIFGTILRGNPHMKGRSIVCNILLQRSADAKEEDGVRDLIDDLFCSLWLSDGDEKITAKTQIDALDDRLGLAQSTTFVAPGVVTPTTPLASMKLSQGRSPQRRSDVAAENIMEVVSAGRTGDHLESLLKKLLNGDVDSETGRKQAAREKRQSLGQKQCTQLVASLFELLLLIDEQRNIRTHVGKDLAATLTAIAVFASICPYTVLKHLDTLLPYLKGDNGVAMDDESSILCAGCDILYRLKSAFDRGTLGRLASSSICKDLTKITYKYGPSTIGSAIRAFSSFAHHPDVEDLPIFADKHLELAKTFYGYLLKKNTIQDFSSANGKLQNGVSRALTILGLTCENYDVVVDSSTWGSEVNNDASALLLCSELTWETLTLACYRLFSQYLQKDDSETKCKALAALKGIFVAQPQLLLQLDHVGLFEDVMSDEAGIPLQLEALECWRNILTAEELRVDSGQADAKMDADGNITVSKRISGDQNGDATLFGGVLTNHASRLFEMTRTKNPAIRRSTLELLGLLLHQGLINPNECVPVLFSLQGDVNNEDIRSLALNLLMAEGEKRPDILRQRICAGVKQAYEFQRLISSSEVLSSAVTKKNGKVVTIFDEVFRDVIGKSQKQRLGLYKSLLGLFELDNIGEFESAKARSTRMAFDLNLLTFAAQILAHLPYSSASDPLYIIHCISATVTLQGLQSLEHFADFFRPLGLAAINEEDDALADEDALERAAQSKFPSRTEEARPLSSSQFDNKKFLALSRDCTILTVLLRLKSFLSETYNLSATRCMEYDPAAKEKLCEKGISKPLLTHAFDGGVDQALVDGTSNKDALIRHYASFRKIMREDTAGSFLKTDELTRPIISEETSD